MISLAEVGHFPMGDAIALAAELGNGNGNDNGNTNAVAADDMVEAIHDATKLPGALVAGGVGEAAAALYLALFESPPGLFLRTRLLLHLYYGVLAAIVLLGVAKAWAGFWVSYDPLRRRAVGMTVLLVPVLPVLFMAGVGGFAILK